MKELIFDLQRFKEIENTVSNQLVEGTEHGDYIKNSGSYVTIISGAGDDTINNTNEMVSIIANSGNNSITNSGHQSTIYTGGGNDYIFNASITDSVLISAGEGNDSIGVGGNEVTIIGGKGDDFINGSGFIYSHHYVTNHYFTYTYGDGNDTISYFNTNSSIINLESSIEYNTVSSGDGQRLSIIFDEDNSIVLKNIYGDINDLKIITIQDNKSSESEKDEKNLTYSGGNQNITNYNGEKINFHADFTGIGFNNTDFMINSSSGTLTIKNARNKVIDVAVGGNTVAYAYLASGAGEINGGGISQLEVILGGNNSANTITAGSGGSSLWGGTGGNDIFTGGAGQDTFFFGKSDGADIINNASSSDVINLYNVSLADILSADISISGSKIYVGFNTGSNLQINSSENLSATFKLADGSFKYNHSTNSWQNA